MTEQKVIRIQVAAIGCKHTVVPHAVAKEQKILWHVFHLGCLVGQHSQIAAIGIGIRRSTGKLIVKFICRNDVHTKTVMTFMEFLQSLCLLQQFLGCRDDDNHICQWVSMMILVGNAIYILRRRHLLAESDKRNGIIISQGYIVQTHRTSR